MIFFFFSGKIPTWEAFAILSSRKFTPVDIYVCGSLNMDQRQGARFLEYAMRVVT